MKSRKMRMTSAWLALAMIAGLVLAWDAPAADRKRSTNSTPAPPAPSTIDPNTGLPTPSWIDPNWQEPDKVISEVSYDSVPLGEIAKSLRKEFNNGFDILIPNGWQDAGDPARTIVPQDFTIRMELKTVRASEIFNAMNMVFETENTPLRWELKMNGNRPTALLRVLPALLPPPIPQPPPPSPQRMIYFVGDLLGDGKSGGMTMEQLVKTVTEVYRMSFGGSEKAITNTLQFHREAQLLVFTGTPDQIRFLQDTLSALRQKVVRNLTPPPRPKLKPEFE